MSDTKPKSELDPYKQEDTPFASRKVFTNLPTDYENYFKLKELCAYHDLKLEFNSGMEKFINANNVFFEVENEKLKLVVAAMNALYRALIGLKLASGG